MSFHAKIIQALQERAMNIYDLADVMGMSDSIGFLESTLLRMRHEGLIEWMYPEDKISLAEKAEL